MKFMYKIDLSKGIDPENLDFLKSFLRDEFAKEDCDFIRQDLVRELLDYFEYNESYIKKIKQRTMFDWIPIDGPPDLDHVWWCPNCRRWVQNNDVTYQERHDPRSGGCGEKVYAGK